MFFLPTFAIHYMRSESYVHRGLLGFVMLAGATAFIPGLRMHKRKYPIALFSIGLTAIAFAAVFAHDLLGHGKEIFISVPGSIILVFSHYLNHKLCHHCKEHKHYGHEVQINSIEEFSNSIKEHFPQLKIETSNDDGWISADILLEKCYIAADKLDGEAEINVYHGKLSEMSSKDFLKTPDKSCKTWGEAYSRVTALVEEFS